MRNLRARDIMQKDVTVVPSDWTVKELATFFVEKAITGAPVTDDAGNVIGVVSLTDIARYESTRDTEVEIERPHDYYLRGWEDEIEADELRNFHVDLIKHETVKHIMTPMVFKIDAETKVAQIAELMVTGRIHRLVVVEDKIPIGIITTMDMLNLLRDDN